MFKLKIISRSKLTTKTGLLVLVLMIIGLRTFSQAPNITYTTPQVYTVNTAITPLSPTNTGGPISSTNGFGQVTTLAGSGTAGLVNATGTAAQFAQPTSLALDAQGNIYVAEFNNRDIRKITPAGVVTTFVSNGLSGPEGLAFDSQGNLFVADYMDNAIKKITPAGVLSVFAGSGTQGFSDGTGLAATFYWPYGVAVDANDNVYVADMGNNAIRKITSAGVVTTIAGNGPTAFGLFDGPGRFAKFTGPNALTVDATGTVIVSDAGNNAIRIVTPAGVVTTFLNNNTISIIGGGIKLNATGNVFISGQNKNQLFKLNVPNNIIATIGNGTAGNVDGTTTTAQFNRPMDIALDASGNIYLVDQGNNTIRKIYIEGYTIDKALPAGLSFNTSTGVISGTPTVASQATDYTITAYNSAGSSFKIVNITVNAANNLITPTISFPPLPRNNGSNLITPAAISTNTAVPITYTSSNTSVAIITSAGLIQLVGPGTTTITALQAGDATHNAATPVPQPMVVTESQAINFPAITAKTTCDVDFPVVASSSNTTIPLTYTSTNPGVATISATGSIHIVSAGTTSIAISQIGSALFDPAPTVSQVLTVAGPIVPTVTIMPDKTVVCAGDVVHFGVGVGFVNNTGLIGSAITHTYQWQVNGVTVSTGSNFNPTNLVSTDVVTCTVATTVGCFTTVTSNAYTGITVTPKITPSVTITTTATGPVCSGTMVIFNATPINGGANPTYLWQVNGVPAANSTGPQFSSTVLANETVTCVVTNNDSPCLTSQIAQSNAIIITIASPANPAPSVTITASARAAYLGVPITFTAATANAGTVLSYQWKVNGVNAGTDNSVFTTSSLNNGDAVTCIVIVSQGCTLAITSNEIDITINPPTTITVPNTFTPNGDGVNDLWDIPGLVSYPNCLVTLYNRYGTQVFQSRGYSKPWDGTIKGGQTPMGVYYYMISLGNNTPDLSGWVAIAR